MKTARGMAFRAGLEGPGRPTGGARPARHVPGTSLKGCQFPNAETSRRTAAQHERPAGVRSRGAPCELQRRRRGWGSTSPPSAATSPLSKRPAHGWVTWHDWFEAVDYPEPRPGFIGIEDYVYLIEAAVAGQGLALGWRHFIDRHIDAGTLVAVMDGFVEFDRCCFARLTERGLRRPVARQCLEAFAALAGRTPPA